VNADRFEVIDLLTARQLLQDLALLVEALGRDDDRNRLADRLRHGVAEDTLCGCIPRRDDASHRLAHDRVIG
jgi:hypothetical protein